MTALSFISSVISTQGKLMLLFFMKPVFLCPLQVHEYGSSMLSNNFSTTFLAFGTNYNIHSSQHACLYKCLSHVSFVCFGKK
jgi:hypothetical protein